ncbi:hypothetical protein V2J09_001051 [Rumex salicifolius]
MASTPPIRPSNVLNVAPLNSIPYIDPVGTNNNSNLTHQGANNGPANPVRPSLLYLPYQPTEEELNNVLSVTNNGVMLGGSAATGLIGPVIGKLDIGEDDTTYIFRVSLPGVAREEFSCDVAPDGQILIRGVTTTGERAVYKDSMKFDMLTQNLCPPGHFSISFKLPGAVDSQQLDAVLGIDGVFEGIVKKKKSVN